MHVSPSTSAHTHWILQTMITLELSSDQVLSQISTYDLVMETFRRMKKHKYASLKMINMMEEYTEAVREAYAETES